ATGAAESLLDRILAGMDFGQGATPPLALSPYTSSRYGFSISYPTGWSAKAAVRDLGQFDSPFWSGDDRVDVFEGTGTGTAPAQPSAGILAIGAATLPPSTSLEEFTNATAGVQCGRKTGAPVSVDGDVGSLAEYDNCQGEFQLWVTVIHEGRGYHILWLDAPANAGFDRAVFRQILATFRSPVPGAPPTS